MKTKNSTDLSVNDYNGFVLNLNNLEIENAFSETSEFKIFSVVHLKSFYILKIEKKPKPDIQNYEHEKSIIRDIQSACIPSSILTYHNKNKIGVLLKTYEGKSLKHYISNSNLSIDQKMQIAIHLTKALETLLRHKCNHLNLDPNTILVASDLDSICFLDLRFSTNASLNPHFKTNQDHSRYGSPEQVGRLNRSLDYRSDIYSLGVILYELFSGNYPYSAITSSQQIHAHLALNPIALSTDNAPQTMISVIKKMMSKEANERYQSYFGILHDLYRIKQSQVEIFDVGLQDKSERLIIPESTIGRSDEISKLLTIYDKVVSGKSQMIFITGDPGIGKSKLIEEFEKELTNQQPLIIRGKFQQFQTTPYSAISEALNHLVHQSRFLENESFKLLKEALCDSVGNNGRVLTDLSPALEQIIGKQPLLDMENPDEIENRFKNTMVGFFKSLATKKHPFILILDDIQWADRASIYLLNLVSTELQHSHFVALFSMRTDDPNAPKVKEWLSRGVQPERISHIPLFPLKIEEISKIISATLNTKNSQELSLLLYQKAGGNPFFTRELIRSLYKHNFIKYYSKTGNWEYDLESIRSYQISENVVDLVKNTLSSLPDKMQNILQIGSVIGNIFYLEVLAEITQTNEETLYSLLEVATDEQIIFYVNSYLTDQTSQIAFRFSHDRIQQGIYESLTDEQRTEIHLNLARYYALKGFSFYSEAAKHFSFCLNTLNSTTELTEVFAIYLFVSHQSLMSGAYTSALEYLQLAESIAKCKNVNLEKSALFSLHNEFMEIYFYLNDESNAEAHFARAKPLVDSYFQEAELYFQKALHYEHTFSLEKSVHCANKCLQILGIKIGTRINPIKFLILFLKTNLDLRKISSVGIESLKKMENRDASLASRSLMCIALNGYFTNKPDLCVQAIFTAFRLNIKFGRSDELGYTLSALAVSYQYLGKFAISHKIASWIPYILDTLESPYYKSRALYCYATTVAPWYEDYNSLPDLFTRVTNFAVKAGDRLAESIGLYMGIYFNSALNHQQGLNYIEEISPRIQARNNKEYYYSSLVVKEFLHHFTTDSENNKNKDDIPLQNVVELLHTKTNISYAHTLNAQMHYFFGNNDLAYQSFLKAVADEKSMSGILSIQQLLAYGFLITRERLKTHPFDVIARYHNIRMKRGLRKWFAFKPYQMERIESIICPFLSSNLNQILECIDKYELILSSSSSENLATFYTICTFRFLELKIPQLAKISIVKAIHYWSILGADKYVVHLRTKFESLLQETKIIQNVIEYNTSDRQASDVYSIEKIQKLFANNRNDSLGCIIKSLGIINEAIGGTESFLIVRNRSGFDVYENSKTLLNINLHKKIDSRLFFENSYKSEVNIHFEEQQKDSKFFNIIICPIAGTLGISEWIYIINDKIKRCFNETHLRSASILTNEISNRRINLELSQSMNEKVSEKTRDLQAILKNINQGILIFNINDFSITPEYSLSAKTILGTENIVGKNVFDVLFGRCNLSAKIRLELEKSVRNGFLPHDLMPGEIEIFDNDFKKAILELEWSHIKDTKNRPIKVIVSFRDVTKFRLFADREKSYAQAIQNSLLSKKNSYPNIDLHGYYQAAENIGGDWYGYFDIPEHSLGFFMIGDVTGHGISSALVTGTVAGALRMAFQTMNFDTLGNQEALNFLCSKVSDIVRTSSAETGRLMTMAFFCFDFKHSQLSYLNAGHNGFLFVSKEGTKVILRGGSPLGLQNGTYGQDQFAFEIGDSIITFTDGLIEQPGPDGKTVKLRSLIKGIRYESSAEHTVSYIKDYSERVWKGCNFEDDCTFVVLKVKKPNDDSKLKSAS